MQGFRAIYIPLIFIIPWVGWPTVTFFASIKKIQEEWTAAVGARDSARGAYNSATDFKGVWPDEGDQTQNEQAFEQKKAEREQALADKEKEFAVRKAEFDVLMNTYMAGIDRSKFDYEKPDEFVYEWLRVQRDVEGPHLIKFLHKAYPNLFFLFDPEVPPIELTPAGLPPTGNQGSLPWPVGKSPLQMTVYGRYNDLLNFVETFPDRYDRITELTDFALQRVAFDHRGEVLMQMQITANMYVWPENAGAGAPAGGGMGGMGMPGMGGEAMPGMGGEAMPGMMPGGPADMGAPPGGAGDAGGAPPPAEAPDAE